MKCAQREGRVSGRWFLEACSQSLTRVQEMRCRRNTCPRLELCPRGAMSWDSTGQQAGPSELWTGLWLQSQIRSERPQIGVFRDSEAERRAQQLNLKPHLRGVHGPNRMAVAAFLFLSHSPSQPYYTPHYSMLKYFFHGNLTQQTRSLGRERPMSFVLSAESQTSGA